MDVLYPINTNESFIAVKSFALRGMKCDEGLNWKREKAKEANDPRSWGGPDSIRNQ